MVRCGRRLTVSLCVLTAAAAVAVTGKPHGRCSSPDDYATAFSAAYYLPGASGTAFGPPLSAAVDYAGVEAAAYRSGRSNGHDGPSDGPVAVAATTDVVAAPAPPVQHAPGHSVKPTAAATSDPCKGPSPAPQAQAANDTASLTVEKLTAYYDRLKAQHETLARRQIEVQLLEQQQRRHREYALVQQQIQQQYYQQQQHALAMLDQLHKNPAFVSQMAAYMEQRLKANNGTANRTVAAAPAVPQAAVVPPAAVVPVAAVPPAVARPRVAAKVDDDDSDQDIVKNLDDDVDDKGDEDDGDDKYDGDDKDDQASDGVPVKRVKPKQIAGRDRAGRIGARSAWKMDARDADDDRHRRRSDDDRIAEKIYSVDSE